MIKVEIIEDSVNEFGNRLTTPLTDMPRIILAEYNTHKMISKNSASSRAIPFEKMVDMVQNNPFIPIKWMKNHKGMQGAEYITDEIDIQLNNNAWLRARDNAVSGAKYLNHGEKEGRDNGVTKQMCNRLLEPFMWHRVLSSGTEWENFFALRAEGMAEIHMQALANEMLLAFNNHTPKKVVGGEWHIPFRNSVDYVKVQEELGTTSSWETDDFLIKIATARSAQTSYTVVGEDQKELNYKKLVALHDRLAVSGHMSPFEHCARAMTEREFYTFSKNIIIPKANLEQYEADNNSDWYDIMAFTDDGVHIVEFGWYGNFRGWIQYRKLFNNENRTDSRLIKR